MADPSGLSGLSGPEPLAPSFSPALAAARPPVRYDLGEVLSPRGPTAPATVSGLRDRRRRQPREAPPPTAPAVLLGRDVTELDDIVSTQHTDRVGLALSRGREEKAYWHLDPNEDGVLAAQGLAGTLLAVVDGHTGADAAEAALAGVASTCPSLDDCWSAPEVVVQWAVDAAREAVAERLATATGLRRGSRTALSIALVSGRAVYTASYGDTSVLRVRGRRVRPLHRPTAFLGPRSPAARVRRTPLWAWDRLVLASDGLTEFLGADLERRVSAAAGLKDPAAAALRLVDDACARGAGDNVAVAVLR